MDRGRKGGGIGEGTGKGKGKGHLNPPFHILKTKESTPAARAEPHAVYTTESCSSVQCSAAQRSAAQYIIPKATHHHQSFIVQQSHHIAARASPLSTTLSHPPPTPLAPTPTRPSHPAVQRIYDRHIAATAVPSLSHLSRPSIATHPVAHTSPHPARLTGCHGKSRPDQTPPAGREPSAWDEHGKGRERKVRACVRAGGWSCWWVVGWWTVNSGSKW